MPASAGAAAASDAVPSAVRRQDVERSGAVLLSLWVSKGPQPFGALFGPFPALEKGLAPQRETPRKKLRLAIIFCWSCLRRPFFFVWAKKKGKRSPAGACGPLHPGDKKVPLRSAALYIRPPDGGRYAASAAFGAGPRCDCDGQAVFRFSIIYSGVVSAAPLSLFCCDRSQVSRFFSVSGSKKCMTLPSKVI